MGGLRPLVHAFRKRQREMYMVNAQGRSHGPGRTARRRGTGSGSCALPAARQGQFGAGRYGACPAAGQPFRGGQNRPTAGAETQFLEPDIGAGSTERTFRVCVSASEKFDRLLRVVGSTGHCNTALSLSAGVSNPKVFLGRWFRRNAILFRYD